jgi:hypothetical protein
MAVPFLAVSLVGGLKVVMRFGFGTRIGGSGGRWVTTGQHVGAELGEEFGVPFRDRWLGVLALALAVEGGKAVEEQLADIGLGDGVAAVDAFASDLLEEIAKVAIDGGGGREILDATEELVGDGLVGLERLGVALSEVMGAERIVPLGKERAATVTAGVDVMTVRVRVILGRHRSTFPSWK